jgi:hypothetical protein
MGRSSIHKYTAKDYVVNPEPGMRLRKPRPAPKMDPWKPRCLPLAAGCAVPEAVVSYVVA